MIEFFLHLLLQLAEDLRQAFAPVEFAADREIDPHHIIPFQKSIQMIRHQKIITVHILKQKQGLAFVQIQIEKNSSQFFLQFSGKVFLRRVKKRGVCFYQYGAVPSVPFVKIDKLPAFSRISFFPE